MSNRPTKLIRDPHHITARTTAPSCADGEEDEPERLGAWRNPRKNFEKRY